MFKLNSDDNFPDSEMIETFGIIATCCRCESRLCGGECNNRLFVCDLVEYWDRDDAKCEWDDLIGL